MLNIFSTGTDCRRLGGINKEHNLLLHFLLSVMPKGAFDPSWPSIDSQQQSQCYPQFNVGRQNQNSASHGVFSTRLKSPSKLGSVANPGTINRNRQCNQIRHRPWSPPGVDQFGRQIPMVRLNLQIF